MRRLRIHTCGPLGGALCAALLAVTLAACGDDRGPRLGVAEEYPPTDEAATTQRLIELTKRALEERHQGGRMLRFNQVRHPGCVRADFEVEGGLDGELAVGLFAEPRSYPTWIRFATATSESDADKDFRGMSLKLMGVEGEMLFGEAPNLDIVLNSHPVLFVGTPKLFAEFIEASLDSHPLVFFLNPLDPHIGSFRIVLAGRKHHASHLEIPYWSTTPYLLGVDLAVKYRAHPCGEVAEPHDDPEHGYLHQAMRDHLAGRDACFDFEVQLQTDPRAMPIEDASVEWESPFHKVATVKIPAQEFHSPAQMEFCENLAFNPWRTLPEHRPLGGMNRVRRELYAELARFRHERNGVRYSEPAPDELF